MKGNFIYSNPVKIYFGDESRRHLTEALKGFGTKVLLVYGGGSIKHNGIYDDVMAALLESGKDVTEVAGVMSNPTLEKLREGCLVAREADVDFILAVGGGSTIDYAKAVSVSTWHDGDPWQDFFVKQQEPAATARIIPVGAVLTMAGTGSEMNGGSVITDTVSKMKITKVFGDRVMPRFAIMNPRYTFSLPRYQMVAGIYDTFSHVMEQYFSGDDDSVSDYLSEGLMRSIIASSRVAIKNPHDYEARSNLMWASSLALNTLIGRGKHQDWMPHMIGKGISAHTNATHGMTLSGIASAYYRYLLKFETARFARFARVVWEIPSEGKSEAEMAVLGVEALEAWIKEIGAATEITSLGVTPSLIGAIADSTILNEGGYKKLSREEVIAILTASL